MIEHRDEQRIRFRAETAENRDRVSVTPFCLIASAELPFDFGEPFWNDTVRIFLFAVMLVLVIAIVVEVIVFFVGQLGRRALD